MELEDLLLGLIDTIRGEGNSRDLAGMIAPVVTGLAPSLGGVSEALSGPAGGGASIVSGLVTGRTGALGAAVPLLGLLGLTGRKASEPEPVSRFELPDSNRMDLGFEASTGALG